MKKTLQKILLSICCFTLMAGTAYAEDDLLAFPGAEGFGRYSKGARAAENPTIYRVTNLNDSGPGSLRDAISEPGRIVIFDVSGVIHIKDRLVFKSNSYIAGQTAPGDGIIVYGNGVSFSGCHNLIIRHMRFYMGRNGNSGADTAGAANGSNMMLDHLSILWGRDENISFNPSSGATIENITIQNSIVGQGLMSHSCGGLIQTNGGVSIIGCLYIDNNTRNPKVKGLNQFINNVLYNWGGSNGYIMGGTENGDSWAWLEGNYFISGPNSSTPFTRATQKFQLYAANNKIDTNKNGILDGIDAQESDYGPVNLKQSREDFESIPKVHPELISEILDPDKALEKVINSVGASLPARSAPDQYLINQLVSYGTEGVMISNENQNGIYQNVGVVSEGKIPADRGEDGIPESWKIATGMVGGALDYAENGYLNIENYINSITGPVAPYIKVASDLKMTDRDITSITISWQNNEEDANALSLEMSEDGINFSEFAPLAADQTTFTIGGLEEETVYYFRIITKKEGMEDSTPSEVLTASTAGLPRPPYETTSPNPVNNGVSPYFTEVTFSWANSTGPWAGEPTFEIYFGESPDNLSLLVADLTAKSYIYDNADLEMGKIYYWKVVAKNTLGTSESDIWSFSTGTNAFTRTLVDLGRNFICNGTLGSGTIVPAESGVLIKDKTTSYTVFPGTVNEMKFSTNGAINNSAGNLYIPKGGSDTYILNMQIGASHYMESTITNNSANGTITTFVINGTSSVTYEYIPVYVLYSDKYPFDTNSVIGFDEVEFKPVREGDNAIVLYPEDGTKSIRIYKKTSITPIDENKYKVGGSTDDTIDMPGSSDNIRVGYVGAMLQMIEDRAATSIENDTKDNPEFIYAAGKIINPNLENISVYNAMGILVLVSEDEAIDVQALPSGLYIAKTKNQTLKFIK